MNLTIDIGNTQTKIIIFDDTIPVYRLVVPELKPTILSEFVRKFPVENFICSSVVKGKKSLFKIIDKIPGKYSFNSKLPVRNKYKTPSTLGQDRLANAIAGAFLFPRKNVLIIDAGTCIKYDFVNAKGEYLGGNISPGLDMRFKSMHEFTGRLPLVAFSEVKSLVGNSTETAIQTGVITGMTEEINGMINRYKMRFKNLKVILTGGDAPHFVNDLNLSIFAAADLVNIGLNEIIRYNTGKK